MPPKKNKRQASGSQPSPDPSQQPARASGRKRRHSDASHASERPGSSQSTAGSVASGKKRRRGKPTREVSAEPDVIAEEDELPHAEDDELAAHHHALYHGSDATAETEPAAPVSIDVSQPRSKHVQFSGAAADRANPTATNLTPHSHKMTIKRRVTLSSAPTTSMRIRSSAGRASLPSAFSQDHDDTEPVEVIRELQFAPLRSVLEARVRRRLRRNRLSEQQNEIEEDAKRSSRTEAELERLKAEAYEKEQRIEDLTFDLETQRQAAINLNDDRDDDAVHELEREIASLKTELATYVAAHGLEQHIEMVPDDEMMVLDSQDELQYPTLPTPQASQSSVTLANGERTSQSFSTGVPGLRKSESSRESFGLSQLTASWEVERRRFEDAILALSKDAQEAKADLQILQIELEGLGFGDSSTGYKAILESIRQSFAHIRESLEITLPDAIPEDASTQDVLDILIFNIQEFTSRLRVQEDDLVTKDTAIADLGNQVQGLLEHLAEAEIRKSDLEKQWRSLDEQCEAKDRDLEAVEEELDTVESKREILQEELREKTEEVRILGADHAEAIKNLEKLTMSLENYRIEEEKLTLLITRMEEEHGATITKMNHEREETVRDLEDRLDSETALRVEAAETSEKRRAEITRLEGVVVETAAERDALRAELTTITAERDAEANGRQTAESDLETKAEQIEDLEGRVDRLEQVLETLNVQLDELRSFNESERHQREAAERDLDDRNLEIEQLNEKLLDQGKQANELRLKLFEVQQQNAERVKELETSASERDERYQTDIAAEVARREESEGLAQQRAVSILELQTRIDEIELRMRNDLTERDERLEALETQLAERNNEIENLRMDLRSVENQLDIEQSNHESRVEELNAEIQTLQDTISEHETTIVHLQDEVTNITQQHGSEIESRDAEIAELHVTVASLESDKVGLERRVEAEAEAMLEVQTQSQDETERLQRAIAEKQDKILLVEQKAVQADKQWQEVLNSKDEELEAHKATATAKEETITTLTTQHSALHQKFMQYVRHSSAVIARLQEAVANARQVVDAEGSAQIAAGEAMLVELDGIDLDSLVQGTQTTVKSVHNQSSSSSAVAKKGRGRKSRRGFDSAIGLDGEAEEELAA